MQRTLGRAYQRLQGNHPRRPDGNRTMEAFCDALFAIGLLAFPAGIAVGLWGCIGKFEPSRVAAGLGLIIISPLALLLWERLAWEPFIERLSQMD